jgi:hypothetical protein
MEHRKRSMMQHKVELSTLLRIVMANKKRARFQLNGKKPRNLIKALASEAIESLKNCDHREVDVKPRIAHVERWFGI